MKCKPLPSFNRLCELLTYDAETGELFWKVSRRGVQAGWPAGGLDKDSGYICVTIDGILYRAHRIIWKIYYGKDPENEIDHKNTCKSENWITNLRDATTSQNNRNVRVTVRNTSGFKGVYFSKARHNWVATICKDRKKFWLGGFSTPAEAHAAYQKAAANMHADFARFQ